MTKYNTTYNTYKEARLKNPYSEIVTTGPAWNGDDQLIGKFQVFIFFDEPNSSGSHVLSDTGWVFCHPKDYEEKQPETPWNGEGYPPIGVECEIEKFNCKFKAKVLFIGKELIILETNDGELSVTIKGTKFRPLETPEQKKEREELEAAYDLYKTFYPLSCITLEEFVGSDIEPKWIEIVRKTNYKLEKPQ